MTFLLFAGDNYYPAGGWDDYRSSHPTCEEAVEAAACLSCDWWQVVCIYDDHPPELFRSGQRDAVNRIDRK